jgi:uncharacterized protein
MEKPLTVADVDALVTGAALLGSGGGGSPKPMAHPLRRAWGEGPVSVLDVGDLPASALVVPVGVVGSTQVFDEKLPGGGELTAAVRAIERWTSVRVDAVLGTEGGGLNGLTGLLAALQLDLPYVDADLMGRALPRLDQFSSVVAGLPATPCALSEPGGQVLLIDGVDAANLERAARAVVSTTGGWGVIAMPPIKAADLRRACVTGSLARALLLGRAVRALPSMPAAKQLQQALAAHVLASGRVVDVAHRPVRQGFGTGSVTLQDAASHAVVRIETENEYLAVLVDGQVVATCPDIISVLDRRNSMPVPAEALRQGVEVTIAVLPGPAWWRDPERIGHVGPRAFGMDLDPVLVQV